MEQHDYQVLQTDKKILNHIEELENHEYFKNSSGAPSDSNAIMLKEIKHKSDQEQSSDAFSNELISTENINQKSEFLDPKHFMMNSDTSPTSTSLITSENEMTFEVEKENEEESENIEFFAGKIRRPDVEMSSILLIKEENTETVTLIRN